MSGCYYIISVSDINAGDILCDRFNLEEKFLVLDDSINLTLLEISTGRFFNPTPLDVIKNFLKVEKND